MVSDLLRLRILCLFLEPRSIVDVVPSRERVGACRITHPIPLGMAQAPGWAMPGDGASDGQAVCRPRRVERLRDVPRVLKHSKLGEMTSRALSLYFRCDYILAILVHLVKI